MADEPKQARLLDGVKLDKQLSAALMMARDSPFWDSQMQLGAQGVIEFIRASMKRGLINATDEVANG